MRKGWKVAICHKKKVATHSDNLVRMGTEKPGEDWERRGCDCGPEAQLE